MSFFMSGSRFFRATLWCPIFPPTSTNKAWSGLRSLDFSSIGNTSNHRRIPRCSASMNLLKWTKRSGFVWAQTNAGWSVLKACCKGVLTELVMSWYLFFTKKSGRAKIGGAMMFTLGKLGNRKKGYSGLKNFVEMRTYLWYMALAIPSSLRDLVILLPVNVLSPVSLIVPTDAR